MSEYLVGVLCLDAYIMASNAPMDAAWDAKIGLSQMFSRHSIEATMRAGWEDRAQANF